MGRVGEEVDGWGRGRAQPLPAPAPCARPTPRPPRAPAPAGLISSAVCLQTRALCRRAPSRQCAAGVPGRPQTPGSETPGALGDG